MQPDWRRVHKRAPPFQVVSDFGEAFISLKHGLRTYTDLETCKVFSR